MHQLLVVRGTFHSHKSHRNGLFSFLFWEYILYLHENYQALLPPILARATHLRTVHIQIVNRPLELVCRALGHALDILRRCSPTISQVGIDTNVWKAGLLLVTVTRSLIIDPGGKTHIDSEGYSGVEAVSHHSREPGYTRTTPRSSRVEKKRMVVFLSVFQPSAVYPRGPIPLFSHVRIPFRQTQPLSYGQAINSSWADRNCRPRANACASSF